MRYTSIFPILLIAIFLIVNIWCWFNVAYYQDEFVFKLITARLIQDGNPPMGIFSMCESWMSPIPYLMQFPAWIISWWYLHVDLQIARLISSLSFALIIFAAVWKSQNYILSLAILAAFIGISSSTIGYTRPEYLHLLNIALSVIIVKGFEKFRSDFKLIVLISGFFLLITYLLSIYSHSQAVLFLPLNLFAIYILFKEQKKLLILFVILFGLFSYHGIKYKNETTSCVKSPALNREMLEHTHRFSDLPKVIFGKNIFDQSRLYIEKFIYKPNFQSKHLPSWSPTALGYWLNKIIIFCVASTLIYGIFIAFLVTTNLLKLRKHLFFRLASENIQINKYLLILFLLIPILFLFVINTDQNFYRNFFVHLIITVSIALYFQIENANTKLQKFRTFWLGIVFFTSLTSTYVNIVSIRPLLNGQKDAYGANWNEVTKKLSFDTSCQLDFSKGRILTDAYAYESIKKYPYIYPTEYIFFQSRKTQISPTRIAESMKMQGMVYACNSNDKLNLCCKIFSKK